MSMSEDQKRASFTLTIAKAHSKASYPLSPITNSSPTAVSPHIQSIATSHSNSHSTTDTPASHSTIRHTYATSPSTLHTVHSSHDA